MSPADMSVNQSAMINQSLSQIQQLALLQKQDAIKKNRQSFNQTQKAEYTSMISYFGA